MIRVRRTAVFGMMYGLSAFSAWGMDGISPTASDKPWTIVTIAPDGSWGVGTKAYIYLAIAEAVSNCKKMSGRGIGCGALFQAVQGDWVIALRCGNDNIFAIGKTHAEAAKAAQDREHVRRTTSTASISSCSHVTTVNPLGIAIPANPGSLNGEAILRKVPQGRHRGPAGDEGIAAGGGHTQPRSP